jgi:hypothetical protein
MRPQTLKSRMLNPACQNRDNFIVGMPALGFPLWNDQDPIQRPNLTPELNRCPYSPSLLVLSTLSGNITKWSNCAFKPYRLRLDNRKRCEDDKQTSSQYMQRTVTPWLIEAVLPPFGR